MKAYLYLTLFLGNTILGTDDLSTFLASKYCQTVPCACICLEACNAYSCEPANSEISSRITSIKSLYRLPIDPVKDFPENVTTFTDTQRETYRQLFVTKQSCALGSPAGWKLALGAASPNNPQLGYTEPAVGQLLSNMLIHNPQAIIDPTFAELPLYEVDLFVRVNSAAINTATTPQEVVEALDLVFPAYELPAGYTETLEDLFGPALGGNSLVPMLNGLARLAVLGDPIPIPGTRTIQDWVTTLNSLSGTEVVTTQNGIITRPFNKVNFLAFALTLIREVSARGFGIKKGDILSLGNLTGTNQLQGIEKQLIATYTNLDPQGPVTVMVFLDPQGQCIA